MEELGALATIREQYPMFSDIEVRDMRDQGIQNGRKLEFTEALGAMIRYGRKLDLPKPISRSFRSSTQPCKAKNLSRRLLANTYTKRQGAVQNMPPCDQS
jgi:hypothetical protein